MKRSVIAALCLFVLCSTTHAVAGQKSIVLGKSKTKWAKSQACSGYAPKYADTVAAGLASRIKKAGFYKVLTGDQARSGSPADYVLALNVLCQPHSVELAVNLVDVESAEIVWSKVETYDRVAEIVPALGKLVRLLGEFARAGKMPSEVENQSTKNSPLNKQTLLLFPIRAVSARIPAKALHALTVFLKGNLTNVAGSNVMPLGEVEAVVAKKPGACGDKDCQLLVAGDYGVEKAMAVKIRAMGKDCILDYVLYDVNSESVAKAASLRTGCSIKSLRSGLAKIVRQLSH
ncbi:MAG TPA: hypothetical protein VM425_03985 [Myxococcota bacterium]|nr:hypothetical protein [Myxococcota bacterium]